MQHVLMPLQIFDDVKNKLFYTVSEETSITLAGFLQGAQQWEDFLCHVDISSIVKQILSGIKFLVSRGLQHNQLTLQNILFTWDGVVKIATIDHITEERPEDWPEDWPRTREAVEALAKSLIQVSEELCLRCPAEICGSHVGQQRCYAASMLADVHSLDELLDLTRTLTETPRSFQSIIQQTLSDAQVLPFIRQAKGSRLGLITKFAWKQIHANATPGGRAVGTITSISRKICEGQSSNGKKKSLERNTRQFPRKPREGRKVYPRRTRRCSKEIEWIKPEKKMVLAS